MKRLLICLLALMLALSFTISAGAEEITTGIVDATQSAEQTEECVSEEITISQFAEKETQPEEMELEQHAEEETGFWAWLKNLWQSILTFFGL